MYTLIHNVGLRKGLLAEAPSLLVAMMVAELFYKFHSFTLECLAFLPTWFAVSYLDTCVRSVWLGKQKVQV